MAGLSGDDALNLAKSYVRKTLQGQGALKGEDGKDGKDGTDGKSAYQVAVDNGFIGTEQEWLDSLKSGSVEISKEENNALEEKEDGLYVGIAGKTYRSLAELGLTAPVKVKDITNAMEIGTEAYIDCTDVSSVVTDLPENGTMPCEIYIRKHFGGMIHVEAILANIRYLGDDGGTAYTWEKVATTNWVSSLVNNPYEYVYDTTIYGNDILKYALGHYKIGNNSTISDFVNLPVSIPGMLDVMCPASGGNQSPWESQYGYRYYRYTTYKGVTYERTLASGATAGNIAEDTGWKKVAYNGESLSLNGLELSSGARISINGSASGVGTLIDGEYFTVDNANTGKSSTITADGIDTPCLTVPDILNETSNKMDNNGFTCGNSDDGGIETNYGRNIINSINKNDAFFAINLWSNGGLTDHNIYSFDKDAFWAELYTGQPSLGKDYAKWNNIYAETSTITTSDRREKTDIIDLDDEVTKKMMMALKPSSYKFVDNTSGRTHYGLIAQDVEDVMKDLGMTSQDFAGFIKSPKMITSEDNPREKVVVEGEYVYALRYEEFIAPIIKVLQMQQKEIENLKNVVKKLQENY